VATEFGFLFMIAVVVCVVVLVLRLAAIARSAPNQSRRELFSLIASIILLMLLGFQENYWEMPQAIFVGLLLMRFLYESAMTRLRAENTEAMENSLHTPVAHGGEQLVTT
jgi:membrane protein CcdC involved in cytochrome C biogenesis